MLSIDIGATWIKSGIVLPDGTLKNRASMATPKDYNAILETLRAIVAASGENSAVIAIPGVYDKLKGKVIFTPNIPSMSGHTLAEDLKINIPFLIENDGNMAALGEYVYGFDTPPDSLVFLTLGTGVGGGIIIDGKLLTGDITSAELGHITLVAEGKLCGCGKRGCVEKYCSYPAMVNYFHEAQGDNAVALPEEIATLFQKGDFAAFEAIDLFSMYLAHTIATLINIFVPKTMRIGGGLSEMKEVFISRAKELAKDFVYPAYRGYTDIGAARLKNDAALLGCAEWWRINK
ncbi:MAG: ROK family protein [Deferribacteraceae bacterium]|nr:ROK family protein [Deferribacteraceae bacterium]